MFKQKLFRIKLLAILTTQHGNVYCAYVGIIVETL